MEGEPSRSRPEAVWRWVELLDAVERQQAQASPTDPHAQRHVAHALDALLQYEHTLTPSTRRQAREWVWLRDRQEPLPPEAIQREWAVCRCQRCLTERVLGRPSIRQLLLLPPSQQAQASLPSWSMGVVVVP